MPPKQRSELAEMNGGEPPLPHRTSANGGSGFEDVDELRDANGLVAIISQRRSNGQMTIGVFKAFERDGREERTAFVPEPLFAAYLELVKLAQERVAKIRAEGSEPIKYTPRGHAARPRQGG
jgi:hypothetical protein